MYHILFVLAQLTMNYVSDNVILLVIVQYKFRQKSRQNKKWKYDYTNCSGTSTLYTVQRDTEQRTRQSTQIN